MRSLSEIKIYLLDIRPEMRSAWEQCFFGLSNVEIVCNDFAMFMKQYKVDCVVSPANGYGLMDGGYDYAITEYFGGELQKNVQRYIIDNLYGEQPVGSSIIIDTGLDGIKLIHTPTMKYPGAIKDVELIYHCMRSTLIAALTSDVKAIVIPAFGGASGCVQDKKIAEMMRRAYGQIAEPPDSIDWRYARSQLFLD